MYNYLEKALAEALKENDNYGGVVIEPQTMWSNGKPNENGETDGLWTVDSKFDLLQVAKTFLTKNRTI